MAEPVLKKTTDKSVEKPADPVLKVVPPKPAAATRARSMVGIFKQYRRIILLAVLPAIAAIIGLTFYMMGGRYISTDNSYVGAQKVLITPDVPGKITRIAVIEGQHVNAGDILFEIDPVPYRLALTQAQSKLAMVRTDFANLKTNLTSVNEMVTTARQNTQLKQNDVERKTALVAKNSGSQFDADNSQAALATAKMQLEQLSQQAAQFRNQLFDNPDLPIEQYPAFMQAQAALEQAERDLDHTVLRAPISATATQVDSIQLGRYVVAGTPVFSLVDDQHIWVDTNPKETDITFLKLGQKAWVHVDTFPGHTFHGTVIAISPGTGAQFAILPPQNASGNWVKVVQRVPVRIQLDTDKDTRNLRSGMSATVDIDTRRRRTLFGDTEAIAERQQ